MISDQWKALLFKELVSYSEFEYILLDVHHWCGKIRRWRERFEDILESKTYDWHEGTDEW
jgi:hypothetical protein